MNIKKILIHVSLSKSNKKCVFYFGMEMDQCRQLLKNQIKSKILNIDYLFSCQEVINAVDRHRN